MDTAVTGERPWMRGPVEMACAMGIQLGFDLIRLLSSVTLS